MQVRLTEKGKKALGFSPDRITASVSDVRAFAMMSRGMAIQDKGFMALYDGPIQKTPMERIVKVEKTLKPKSKPKRKKATSKKAEVREKAIKT